MEHGANIHKEKDRFAETPLFYTSENGNKTIVKYLVEKGADIHKTDFNVRTPFF